MLSENVRRKQGTLLLWRVPHTFVHINIKYYIFRALSSAFTIFCRVNAFGMYGGIEYFLEENVFIPRPSDAQMSLPSGFLDYQVCSHKTVIEYWGYQDADCPTFLQSL